MTFPKPITTLSTMVLLPLHSHKPPYSLWSPPPVLWGRSAIFEHKRYDALHFILGRGRHQLPNGPGLPYISKAKVKHPLPYKTCQLHRALLPAG